MMTKNNSSLSDATGLYIHIPFCSSKCNYCDFLSYAGMNEESIALYFNALNSEIQNHNDLRSLKIDTLFIGGGTPSYIPEHFIEELMKNICELYFKKITTDPTTDNGKVGGLNIMEESIEMTIEVNPGTLNVEKLKIYRDSSINRLSMGVQSFDESLLKFMGRTHSKEDVFRNFGEARKAGFDNINLDLMFGVPGQSIEMWKNTLKTAIELEPEHISFYSLQIEEATPFFRAFKANLIDELPDDLNREMYYSAIELLNKEGYVHYEISNASKPGFECIHNLKYWSMENYLGLGLGAHSYIDGSRRCNTSDFNYYLSQNKKIVSEHENTLDDDLEEYMFTGLRKVNGISVEAFKKRFGCDIDEIYGEELHRLVDGKLIIRKKYSIEEMICLTPLGIDVSNYVLCEFIR